MLSEFGEFDGFVIFFYLIIRDRAVAAGSMNSHVYRNIGGARCGERKPLYEQ